MSLTPKQEMQRRYNNTPEAKERRRKYRATPGAKVLNREYQRKRNATPEVKASNLKYRSTPKWKETRQKYYVMLKEKGRNREYQLKSSYGLKPEEWDAMFLAQGSKCAICKRMEPVGRNWHTDHCHSSGRVRGILCQPCNVMLGGAKDKIDNLIAAITYLWQY